jgi:hypothetical protein
MRDEFCFLKVEICQKEMSGAGKMVDGLVAVGALCAKNSKHFGEKEWMIYLRTLLIDQGNVDRLTGTQSSI